MTVRRFSLLAAAVAGRGLHVVSGGFDFPYTDGETVYLPEWDDLDAARAAVVVQAGLIAVGSLDRQYLGRLARVRPATLRRYLVLEVARASAELSELIPRPVAEHISRVYDI